MLDVLEKAAVEAGRVILAIYETRLEVRHKADCSPVTDADEAAERIILRHLSDAFPQIPVVAEEAASAGAVPDIDGRAFFLVDPLDGTREFIGRHHDFTVNIALIEEGRPVTASSMPRRSAFLYAAMAARPASRSCPVAWRSARRC